MIRTVLLIATAIAAAFPAFGANGPLSARSSVLGATWSRSFRRGYFVVRGFAQDSIQRPLSLWGAYGARRYDLTPWLGLQVAAEFGFGSNEIDTLYGVPIDNGSYRDAVAQTEEITVIGAVPSLLYLLPPMQRLEPFLAIAAGVYYARYREIGRTNPGWALLREGIGLPAASESRAVRVDVRAGAGIGIRLRADVSLDIGYIFKYWSPVACEFLHDLPLHGVAYWETFRTHEVRLGVVWGRQEK